MNKILKKIITKIFKIICWCVVTVLLAYLLFLLFLLSLIVLPEINYDRAGNEFITNFCESPQKSYAMTTNSFQKSYSFADFQENFPIGFCRENVEIFTETTGLLSDESSVYTFFKAKHYTPTLGLSLKKDLPWTFKVQEFSTTSSSLSRVNADNQRKYCENWVAGKFEIPNAGPGYCGVSALEIQKRNYVSRQLNKRKRWRWLENIFEF